MHPAGTSCLLYKGSATGAPGFYIFTALGLGLIWLGVQSITNPEDMSPPLFLWRVVMVLGVGMVAFSARTLLIRRGWGSLLDLAGRRIVWWRGRERGAVNVDDIAAIVTSDDPVEIDIQLIDRLGKELKLPNICVGEHRKWAATVHRHFPHVTVTNQ